MHAHHGIVESHSVGRTPVRYNGKPCLIVAHCMQAAAVHNRQTTANTGTVVRVCKCSSVHQLFVACRVERLGQDIHVRYARVQATSEAMGIPVVSFGHLGGQSTS